MHLANDENHHTEPFRRYGGVFTGRNIGLEKFVEVRGISIAFGLPLGIIFLAVGLPLAGILIAASSVLFFLFGFIGEISIIIGFYFVIAIAYFAFWLSVYFTNFYYIDSITVFLYQCFVIWLAWPLYKREKVNKSSKLNSQKARNFS